MAYVFFGIQLYYLYTIALDRHEQKAIKIWILRVDATRIVPKRARDLLYFDAFDRSELAARITNLISQCEYKAPGADKGA